MGAWVRWPDDARADERGAERLAGEVLAALSVEGSAWTRRRWSARSPHACPSCERTGALAQVRAVQRAAGRSSHRVVWISRRGSVRGVARAMLDEPGVQRYSTRALVEQEQRIVRWFARRPRVAARRWRLAPGCRAGLIPSRRRPPVLVAGTSGLVVVVGPAGAGKTSAMRAAVQRDRAAGPGGAGAGAVGPAAEQLERQAGVGAETVERFLTCHELPDGPGGELGLPAGATLIVDEAGMLRTQDVERLLRVARARGYRLALVGDSRQLAAVGRGGMFDEARSIAPRVQLREVRRFAERVGSRRVATAARLRPAGDRRLPAARQDQGRQRRADASTAMLADWWQARQDGHKPAFTVPDQRTGVHAQRGRPPQAG